MYCGGRLPPRSDASPPDDQQHAHTLNLLRDRGFPIATGKAQLSTCKVRTPVRVSYYELAGYRLAHAARADLCRQLGRTAEVRAAYERVLGLTLDLPRRR
jgi:hypothetical protein